MPQLFETYWDQIKDKTLFDLTLLSSHDSCAYKFDDHYSQILSDNATLTNFSSMPPYMRRLLGIQSILQGFARTQDIDLTAQLNCGVRCFDLRVALIDGKLVLNHTIVIDELSDILPEFHNFLMSNSKEIIELQLKYTDTNPNANLQDMIMRSIRESALGPYLIRREDMGKPIHELVESNKRVLIFIEGPPIDDAMDLYSFKNVYRGFNVAAAKIEDLRAQLLSFTRSVDAIFRAEFTLTPTGDDIRDAVLRRNAGSALRRLTASLPDPIETIGNDLAKVHVVAVDFVNPCNRLAERLMDSCLSLIKPRNN